MSKEETFECSSHMDLSYLLDAVTYEHQRVTYSPASSSSRLKLTRLAVMATSIMTAMKEIERNWKEKSV